jgi:hypothetical protein
LKKGDERDAPVNRKYLKVGAVGKYFYSKAPTYRCEYRLLEADFA